MRCVFILVCSTALFSPAADAYTVIAVASSSSNGGGEQCAYQFSTRQLPEKHGLFLCRDLSRSEIEHGAVKRCSRYGGINPKIVLSTGKYGYFAIAVGVRIGTGQVVGWSGTLPVLRLQRVRRSQSARSVGGRSPYLVAVA
jgi:hypothetical protein